MRDFPCSICGHRYSIHRITGPINCYDCVDINVPHQDVPNKPPWEHIYKPDNLRYLEYLEKLEEYKSTEVV